MLLGRRAEQGRITELLAGARNGTSGRLVLVGEPGIGKSALLEFAAAEADGFEIARARGVESEAELPFGALFELLRPFLDRLDRLEPQQAAALRVTFGMGGDYQATGFAIGAAALSLMAAVAEDRPLLLVVDDGHWLDRGSADALAFAVRRLQADAVVALFATRPDPNHLIAGRDLPERELEGLDEKTAKALLETTSEGTLAPDAKRSVLALASGNPLALLELPRWILPEGAGAEPARLGRYLENAFATRAGALPEPTRRALLVAAAITSADVDVLGKALRALELSLEHLEPAESAGLLSLEGGSVQFRHPLVRSALYHAAPPGDRRRAHAVVAAAIGDDDRGAWHLAAAAVGPDEAAAAALERAAGSALGRSGFSAAATAYERAAGLSERGDDRQRRLTAAADAAWLAGSTGRALGLIDDALGEADDARQRGELLHTRGTIEHFIGDAARAHRTLEEAAGILAELDPRQASLSLTEAVGSALFTGEVERAARLGERAEEIADPRHLDQQIFASISRGASLFMTGRPEEAVPFLRRALDAARGEVLEDDPRNLTWAALAGWWAGDGALMTIKARGALEWGREHAALAVMPWAATLLGSGLIMTGRWREARAALEEGAEAGRLTEQEGHLSMVLSPLAWLDAAQGRADECRAHVHEGLALTDALGLRWLRNWLLGALVVDELGRGLEQGSPGVTLLRRSLAELPLREVPSTSSWTDLIEALLRLGDVEDAENLLRPFADEAERVGDPYALARTERCHGLHPATSAFEGHFEHALRLHEVASNPFEVARTRLGYGERLRRSGRRVDSRAQLREALTVFERLEAAPWAERARAELRATGERLRARDPAAEEELTPQELQIALVVSEGKTNREAGAQLFLSPKTVEWHLGRIYGKLGVKSRAQLARALAG